MNPVARFLFWSSIALFATATHAATTIEYAITSDAVDHTRPPVHGALRSVIEIDGPDFRIKGRGALESSSDDGFTTWFGDDRTTTQAPLSAPGVVATATAPIVGRLQDETLVVGPSSPGPERFGLPTRVYTIDYQYSIGGRALLIPLRPYKSHARYTMTVVDIDTSAAGVRVMLSRGYNYALSQHGEAFTGLPVHMEGTIDAEGSHVTFALDAESLTR